MLVVRYVIRVEQVEYLEANPADLVEDGSDSSDSTTVLNLQATYQFNLTTRIPK